ncbi:hypothetical protein EDB80DRAFT_825576 [Ilyonectria destructans]|nr:hypothetical protein EDB80DRAFT_825576 [Ilyonectria destructans]
MSSTILGDSSSLHERPGREKKHNTSLPANTPTDPNPVDPADGDSTGHVVRAQGPRCHHQSPRGEHCSGKGWGPEFFPNGEDPGTLTEMNSPACYEAFAAALQPEPLQEPSHGTSPTRKPGGRRKAKSNQPTRTIRGSRIEKKQVKRPKRDGNTLGTASGRPVPPGIQRELEHFQEELRLLEEQNKRRLEASQGEPSEKRI